MQPPQGLAEKVKGLRKLKSIADSQPKRVRSGPCAGGRAHRRRGRSRPPAGPDLLAGRRRAVHHAPGRHHERSARRLPQRRHVPDAGARRQDHGDALADPQRRPRRLPARRGPHGRRRRDRPRPGHGLRGERAAAEERRRADARGLPARRARRARPRENGRSRGSGECGDRAGGLHRQGRPHERRTVRRPHGLLHAARALPGLSRRGDHDAARRDLPVDRGREAAGRGRVARQGDGADLPARDPDERARSSSTTTFRSRVRSTTAASSRSARPSRARRKR